MPHSFLFPAPKVHALSPAQCHLTTACPQGCWKQRCADRHNQICSLLWICLKIGQNWVVSFTSWASISVLQYTSCCSGSNCKWLGKWSGCDTWVQMSLGMPLCSFLSTSPALLSRGVCTVTCPGWRLGNSASPVCTGAWPLHCKIHL